MKLTADQKEALALNLTNQVLAFVEGNSHQAVLTALINAYIAVATAYPCCTQKSSESAMQASMLLAQNAAHNLSTHIH